MGSTPTAKETIHPDWAQLCRKDKRGLHVFRLCSLRDLLEWEAQHRGGDPDPGPNPNPTAVPVPVSVSDLLLASAHSQRQQDVAVDVEEQLLEQLQQDDQASVHSSHDLLLFQELRKSAAILQQPQLQRLGAGS